MRNVNFFKEIVLKYFNKDLDARIHIFNLLMFTGIVAGFVVAYIAIAFSGSLTVIFINALISVLAYGLLRSVEEDNRRCRFYSWLVIVVVFLVAFPTLFFYSGGISGGTPFTFILAFVFTGILLDGIERVAALVMEYILYVACSLISYYDPGSAQTLIGGGNFFASMMINLTVTCVLLLFVLLIRSRMIAHRQTEIEELNRELEERNKTLIRYDQMKSDFLATVAHEINTPLAVISAGSHDTKDLLAESPLNIGEIADNQNLIAKKVMLIDKILLDLMDAVAIENGRFSLNRRPTDLAALLTGVCGETFKQLNLNGNKLTYDFELNLPPVWADKARLEQVMDNLLSNAVRHTQNGEIRIELKRAGAVQTVSVADDGDGMDLEIAQTVLKEYVSTKTDYWRHGIGLHVCRRIVTAHGGDIHIDSEKGRGTKISFTLKEVPEYE